MFDFEGDPLDNDEVNLLHKKVIHYQVPLGIYEYHFDTKEIWFLYGTDKESKECIYEDEKLLFESSLTLSKKVTIIEEEALKVIQIFKTFLEEN
ncbi:MAG: hypothetical protein WCJ62_09580 [Flavobacterium sp.]